MAVRQGVERCGEVVAGTAGQVDYQAWRGGFVARGQRSDGGRERPVVIAAEEAIASRDHGGGVARAGSGPACGEVDVAAPGDVEAVPAIAAQAGVFCPHRASADRTAQVSDGRRQRTSA